jgi:hypothetical protein
MTRLSIFVVVAGLVVSLTGCGEIEEIPPTYIVYGTVTSTSVDAHDKIAWIKLVDMQGKIEDPPLYSSSCTMTGPSCDYKVLYVLEGEYAVFGIIDMDYSASYESIVADSGDLITPAKPLWLWERTLLDLTDEMWRLVP